MVAFRPIPFAHATRRGLRQARGARTTRGAKRRLPQVRADHVVRAGATCASRPRVGIAFVSRTRLLLGHWEALRVGAAQAQERAANSPEGQLRSSFRPRSRASFAIRLLRGAG